MTSLAGHATFHSFYHSIRNMGAHDPRAIRETPQRLNVSLDCITEGSTAVGLGFFCTSWTFSLLEALF